MSPRTAPDPTSFADALTTAIQQRGLSLERIRARLAKAEVPVSTATLSYWQSGRSLPTRSRSFHTLTELERILGVESGHLSQYTYTADGRTRRGVFAWQTVLPASELASTIIDDLGLEMRGQVTRVMVMDALTINPDRTESTQDSRLIWRAERNGLPRWPIVLEQDAHTAEGAVPSVSALLGCRVGEVVEVPERHLIVAEMIGPRPLRRGELFASEHRVTYAATGLASFRMQRALSESVRVLGLAVRFDPGALPARVEWRVQASLDAEASEVEPVALAGGEGQVVRTDARPGVYSLYWEWE